MIIVKKFVKKFSFLIAAAALSAFCLGWLEATHTYPAYSHSEFHEEELSSSPSVAGGQEVLVVPPDASDRPVYSVFTGISTFLAIAEETGGQFSLFDLSVSPQTGPPPHIHNDQDEAFYVLDGKIQLTLGNQTIAAPPGTFAYVPRGRRHRFQNLGTTPARMLALTIPSGFEGFFAEEGKPVVDRSNPPPPRQNLEEIAPIAAKYDTQLALSSESSNIAPELRDFVLVLPGASARPSFNLLGSLFTFLATSEETGGQFSLFNVDLPPQVKPRLLRLLQSNEQEAHSFYVLEGKVKFQIENKTIAAAPGTFIYLPKGTPYAFQNSGTQPARMLSLITPTPVSESSAS